MTIAISDQTLSDIRRINRNPSPAWRRFVGRLRTESVRDAALAIVERATALEPTVPFVETIKAMVGGVGVRRGPVVAGMVDTYIRRHLLQGEDPAEVG